jgi:hypothetical protein
MQDTTRQSPGRSITTDEHDRAVADFLAKRAAAMAKTRAA